VPDPRIAGAQIFFDSRLDRQGQDSDPFLNQVRGQQQRPPFARTVRDDEIKPSFNQDAEALYDPHDHGEFLSELDKGKRDRLMASVEKYNIFMNHL